MIAWPVRFRREAERDVAEARDWYEDRSPGLGGQFVDEVDAAVQRLRENPRGYQVVYRGARRILLRRFPYKLVYVVRKDDIVVVACSHGARDPQHWIGRV